MNIGEGELEERGEHGEPGLRVILRLCSLASSSPHSTQVPHDAWQGGWTAQAAASLLGHVGGMSRCRRSAHLGTPSSWWEASRSSVCDGGKDRMVR